MLEIIPLEESALKHNYDFQCGPQICAAFGCNVALSRYEKLCGNHCISHQKKHEKDPADLLTGIEWEFSVIMPLDK